MLSMIESDVQEYMQTILRRQCMVITRLTLLSDLFSLKLSLS